jgi:hypothetical protein
MMLRQRAAAAPPERAVAMGRERVLAATGEEAQGMVQDLDGSQRRLSAWGLHLEI